MLADGQWVFGYGSLVSPASIARTLGRPVESDRGRLPAVLHGYGRRWNYGSLHLRADWHHDGVDVRLGVVVSLGLAPVDGCCNGVVVQVDADELALLDWRERDYDRVDVTGRIETAATLPAEAQVVTYVPRDGAVHRYRTARDGRRAAVRREYVDLVRASFAELGEHQLADYEASTPEPDVPVLDLRTIDTSTGAS